MDFETFEHKKELRFGSMITLRSYQVERCIKQNKGIKVRYHDKIMTLTPSDVSLKAHKNTFNQFVAQYTNKDIKKGQKYYLVDYTFVDDKQRKQEPDQKTLF